MDNETDAIESTDAVLFDSRSHPLLKYLSENPAIAAIGIPGSGHLDGVGLQIADLMAIGANGGVTGFFRLFCRRIFCVGTERKQTTLSDKKYGSKRIGLR